MNNNKSVLSKHLEILTLGLIFGLIVFNAIINGDKPVAVISAICGITYTFYAGKGRPICYIFGLCGSCLYGFLAFQSSLWGNLLLYVLYYIPMQILGYFKWNSHLKEDKQEIIKVSMQKKAFSLLCIALVCITACLTVALYYFKDTHPILDSITTIFSVGGMYLTVKRTIEQWFFWGIVNLLSFIMWLHLALGGAKVWSTVIMWGVYTVLAIYFYCCWKKEITAYDSNKH